jgi:long-chain acyl-CoA synthetase
MIRMSSDDYPTIPGLLASTLARVPEQPALGTIKNGQLTWRTWAEIDADVHALAGALQDAGVEFGDRVAQLSENRYEWIVSDLAILSLGAVHVPLHTSLSPEQIAEQVRDSGAKLLFVSAAAPKSLASQLDPAVCIVSHDAPLAAGLSRRAGTGLRPSKLAASESTTNATAVRPSALRSPPSAFDPATLLYTSGTTGRPQGVLLSHQNLVANAVATTEAVGGGHDETRLCFLPLSHIYARTCDLYTWLQRGTRLVLAENRDTIIRDCQLARPTVINGVPYFYQKIAQQLRAANETGKRDAIRTLLGGNLKRCFCGGAAVAPEVEALFVDQGLPLLSGYGLTEAAPVVSATSLENYRLGTVGRPLANLEVQLAPDGEILVRGPSVMLGYWQDPLATAAAIAEGWLCTGDLGEMDVEGNLKIIGRKKEIIVLSTGRNVSPARVEQLLASSPLVEHVCVVGEGRPCLAALIVPNPEALRAEIRRRRLWVWSKRRAVNHPEIRALYRAEIDRLLAAASHFEQVGPFAILTRSFSIPRGELTPKLSLRRSQIAANFAPLIERIYAPSPARR